MIPLSTTYCSLSLDFRVRVECTKNFPLRKGLHFITENENNRIKGWIKLKHKWSQLDNILF